MHSVAHSLATNGVEAAVWHGRRAPETLGFPSPVVVGLQRTLEPGDVLVMPEFGGRHWSFLVSELPVAMLVQGPRGFVAGGRLDAASEDPYPGWPTAQAAVTTSETLYDLVQAVVPRTFPTYSIPVSIDTDLFSPLQKRRVISMMPRRRRCELSGVVQILRSRGVFDTWDLQIIEGMSPGGVAKALGESAIFLSGAEFEGFALPGAEAMSAGAQVVGFTGHGATEYMGGGRAEIVAEGDLVGMADAVQRSIALFENQPRDFEHRSSANRRFIVDRYNRGRATRAAVEVFGRIARSGSAAVVETPRQVSHFNAPHGRRERWMRRAAAGRERLLQLGGRSA